MEDERRRGRRETVASKMFDWCGENSKTVIGVAGAVALTGFVFTRYKVASPSQFLAMTGPGIQGVKVAKQAIQWPLQTVRTVDMTPFTYEVHLSAMSSDMQDMGLPLTFSIGPDLDYESQVRYATLLGGCENVMTVVAAIVEPEARSVAANLPIDAIFKDRAAFREKVQQSVQEDLKQFGLRVWQSGIREIEDDKARKDGTKYFHFLRLIKSSEAEQTTRKSVAEMERGGNITVKEKERDTRMKTSEFEATAVEVESRAKIDVAKFTSAMQVEQARFAQQAEVAKIESEKAVLLRDADLQREVERMRVLQMTELERSHVMAKTTVEAEAMERMASAKLIAAQREADALYAKAEAEAKGSLAKAESEAKGIRMKFEAQADGMERLKESLGSASNLLMHEMIQKGTYTSIAESSAEALRGMKPTITSWTTDGGASSDPSSFASVAKNLIPLLDIVNKQTGIMPPSWIAQMSGASASPDQPKKD